MIRNKDNTPLARVEHPTRQQVFDAVVRHAATMPKRSASGPTINHTCLYRGPKGRVCFVGCLLTDDEARGLDDDGAGIFRTLANAGLAPKRLMWPELIALIEELQIIHDSTIVVGMWPWMLRNTAYDFELSTSVIDECFPGCIPNQVFHLDRM